jgi:hypothetical protein
MKLMDRAREIAAKTPPQRNRYVDFLRAVSICVVVLGHWLIAVFTVADERIVVGHLLAEAPWTHALTWIFQVMPVFFIVGGFSNAASWNAALKTGKSYGNWLRSRCQRLLGPTVVFAMAWVPIALFARLFVADEQILVVGARLVAVPLWFLAVYLAVIPAAPAMFWLHRRFGAAVPVALTLAAAVVDFLDRTRPIKGEAIEPSLGWVNFALVWLAIHQIGFFWWEGRLDETSRRKWVLVAGGLLGLVLLTFSGLYPFSMIGVPGDRTNNTPPTVVLVFLALLQMGLILISSPWARQRLARTEPWARTIVANGMIMTLFLWHLTAMIVVVFAGFKLGIRFDIEPLSGAWWLARLAWFALLSVILLGFVAVFGRFERPRPAPEVEEGWKWGIISCCGALLAGAGLASLAIGGFYTPNEYWGIPVGTLLALLLGAAAVGVTPRIYGRDRAVTR